MVVSLGFEHDSELEAFRAGPGKGRMLWEQVEELAEEQRPVGGIGRIQGLKTLRLTIRRASGTRA